MSVFCVGMIYIPLCLYLYCLCLLTSSFITHIYIPLCLYLYWRRVTFLRQWWEIYIPLCLYLYLTPRAARELKRVYLHSTMFIFIFFCLESVPDCHCIYIPLCLYLYLDRQIRSCIQYNHLHSTMFIFIFTKEFFADQQLLTLHSTMFIFIFYSIVYSSYTSYCFTFHYVYIYIPPDLWFLRYAFRFTFHYVYIYMGSVWITNTQ